MKNKFLLIFLIFSFMTLVAGCNMMRGLGEDVDNVGEGIQRI